LKLVRSALILCGFFLLGLLAGLYVSRAHASEDTTLGFEASATGVLRNATAHLQSCTALRVVYPDAVKRLESLKPRVVASVLSLPDVCAFAAVEVGTLYVFPSVWQEHSVGCYENNVEKVLAHELLHFAGLPTHKTYSNYATYEKNDPIEQVIKACYAKS